MSDGVKQEPRLDDQGYLLDVSEVEAAMTSANRATVLRHRSLGIPLLVWRDGRMVEVDPWTIELPGEGNGRERG